MKAPPVGQGNGAAQSRFANGPSTPANAPPNPFSGPRQARARSSTLSPPLLGGPGNSRLTIVSDAGTSSTAQPSDRSRITACAARRVLCPLVPPLPLP